MYGISYMIYHIISIIDHIVKRQGRMRWFADRAGERRQKLVVLNCQKSFRNILSEEELKSFQGK